jgi:U4/U6 small nuclear ribonucleoprotein PRP31
VDILPASSIITISLSASSSAGKQLPEDELHKIFEGCDMALALDEARKTILRYVESRMTNYAPNLTEIVGSEVAARLIGLAGGLTALSKMPSSTIMNLGSKKKSLEGFSSSTAVNHFGYVYECDFVKRSAPDYRTKACRLVAGKCTLAARVDSFHESQNGEIGRNFKSEIEKKLDKWHEPPPLRKEKPLAAPDEKKKPRRGGRKARKMKERYGMTEMRKQANRMSFGPEQADGFDFSNRLGVDKDLGLVGKSGSGSVRLRVIDGKGMKIKAKKVKQLNTSTSGLATSVYAMTPAQGLTLADPELQKKRVQEANEKYFSSTSGFSKVAKK